MPCGFALPSGGAWRVLAMGQVISLLVAGTGVCSQALVEKGVSMPTTQSALNYFLLSMILWVKLARRWCGADGCRAPWGSACAGDRTALLGDRGRAVPSAPAADMANRGGGAAAQGAPWWVYLVVAIMDVEANFLVVSAYQYTAITSVMLLDCLSIPFCMILLRTAVGTRFLPRHLAAAVVCLGGVVALVVGDALPGASGGAGPDPSTRWVGDLLCIGGAALYALSNVSQEVLVQLYGPTDFLGGLGGFGVLVSGLQIAVLARGETEAWGRWDGEVAGLVLGFGLCLFCMYLLTARFFQESNAAVFNLSLLTSDLWAILSSALLFGQALQPLYFLALALVVVGLVLYHSGPAPEDAKAGGCLGPLLERSRRRANLTVESSDDDEPDDALALDPTAGKGDGDGAGGVASRSVSAPTGSGGAAGEPAAAMPAQV